MDASGIRTTSEPTGKDSAKPTGGGMFGEKVSVVVSPKPAATAAKSFAGTWRKQDGYHIAIDIQNDGSVAVKVAGREASNISFHEQERSIGFDWPNTKWGRATFVYDTETIILEKKGTTAVRWAKVPSFLSAEDVQAFRKDGFLILREAVPLNLIRKAKRAILSDIGQNGIPPDRIAEFSAQSYTPQLRKDSAKRHSLDDVFRASAIPLSLTALFDVNITLPWDNTASAPQVALRFPLHPDSDSFSSPGTSGKHIDGIPTGDNGLKGPILHSFSALTGIAITNQMSDYAGNLVVYPGSHLRIAEKLQMQWTEQSMISEGKRVLGPEPIQGSSWSLDEICQDLSPLQLKLAAGDAVICHYNLVHCVSENRNDDIRMQLYHRIRHCKHGTGSLLDIWKDYHPILSDEFNP